MDDALNEMRLDEMNRLTTLAGLTVFLFPYFLVFLSFLLTLFLFSLSPLSLPFPGPPPFGPHFQFRVWVYNPVLVAKAFLFSFFKLPILSSSKILLLILLRRGRDR